MIRYAAFNVEMHGLELKSEAELETLRLALYEAISQIHPSGYSNSMESDVVVEVTEHAGKPTLCLTPEEPAKCREEMNVITRQGLDMVMAMIPPSVERELYKVKIAEYRDKAEALAQNTLNSKPCDGELGNTDDQKIKPD